MGILVIKYRKSFLPISVKDCQILKSLAKFDGLERVNNIFSIPGCPYDRVLLSITSLNNYNQNNESPLFH